jgi:hypothetical protein
MLHPKDNTWRTDFQKLPPNFQTGKSSRPGQETSAEEHHRRAGVLQYCLYQLKTLKYSGNSMYRLSLVKKKCILPTRGIYVFRDSQNKHKLLLNRT